MTVQLSEVINDAIKEALSSLHTVVVGKVTGVDLHTINVQPVVNRVVKGESIPLPEFVEVPPIFLQGGGNYTAHPIAIGDYCLLLISERCFDRWYSGQDFESPAELRMHDYSDAIAIVGINPLAGAIAIPETKTISVGDVEHTGDYEIIGDLHVDGNITCTGTITGDVDVVADGVSLKSHTHNFVETGTPGTYVTAAPN